MDYKTAGESHGKALIGIISGYPSGVPIITDHINLMLKRRQKGYGRGGRMSIESDIVEIISGVRKGLSTGSPISFMIKNRDWENWKNLMDPARPEEATENEELLMDPRPGHADFPGMLKYRLNTIRDVIERSSARETAVRVCIGAFAMAVIELLGFTIFSYVDRIGNVLLDKMPNLNDANVLKQIESSEVSCPDKKISDRMIASIYNAHKNGNTIGGSFKIVVKGLFPGLGSYTDWDMRLDSRIACAVMGIPAIKAVEIGEGISSGTSMGLEFHDEIYHNQKKGFYRKTNNAGGIEGGMTNGEDIVVGAVMKPIPTTTKGMKTVNLLTKKESVSLKERSDTCAVPSAAVVGEAVIAIELLKAIQEKFGSDNIDEIRENLNNYKEYLNNI